MMIKTKFVIAVIIAVLILTAHAYADVVWPALDLENRIITWWAISVGLLAEYIFVRMYFKFSIKKAILADLLMNLASTILGIALIPIAGIAWELFPGIVMYKLFNIGTFNPGTWIATFIFAVAINAGIESIVIAKAFRTQVGRRGFLVLIAANSISVAIAFVSLFLFPVRT